jgi:GT2 family glycosyltransferase
VVSGEEAAAAAKTMSGDVTVIVPVWNRCDLLEQLLSGLRTQTQPPAEVLVVDDGSEDGPADLAGARVIRMGAHGGFAKAVNRGIRESRTPLVAIVNNDVELAPDWMEKLRGALSPDVWFATGKLLQAATRDRIDGTFDLVCRGGTACRAGQGSPDGPAFGESRRIWSAPMTAALFRAELFEKAGLLDERFESYLEDVDFGIRCRLAGCAGRYTPEALAWHQGSATLGRWHPETVRRMARNQVFLIAKYYSGHMLRCCAWHILVAQTLWGLVALRHGRAWPWVRGKAEGLGRWREFRQRVPAEWLPAEDERDIRRERDLYWRLYFLLTGMGQSDT